jgi:hypothetical protein
MTQPNEILLIGEDFVPGAVANTEIDTLLGFDAVMCGDFAIRTEDGYTPCPNYCGNSELSILELNQIDIHPIILPATHQSSKRRSKRAKESAEDLADLYVAVFVIGADTYATKPFESEENVYACVLWYALAYYS